MLAVPDVRRADRAQIGTLVIEVVHVQKSARVTETAEAVLDVHGEHSWDEVVDAGLAALREDRDSLFGYGIKSHPFKAVVANRVVTVFAHRD